MIWEGKINRFAAYLARLGMGFAVLLLACVGGGGPSGGDVGGGGIALDSGNFGAGPVDMDAPVTINKSLIYCDNVEGPLVKCRGDNGAVPPSARVMLAVKDSNYAKSGFPFFGINEAHAAVGDYTFCNANNMGAFGEPVGPCQVQANENDKVAICVVNTKGICMGGELVLTIGPEGTTTQGNTGTMKNLAIDPGSGDGFHSHFWQSPFHKVLAWVMEGLGVRSAHAQVIQISANQDQINNQSGGILVGVAEVSPVFAQYPSVNNTCGENTVNWNSLPDSDNLDPQCWVKRVRADTNISENFVGIPTCENGQASISDIEIYADGGTGKTALAVAVDNWVYLIDKESKSVIRRLPFPYKVQDIIPLGPKIMFFLGGENFPDDAQSVYFWDNEGNYEFKCDLLNIGNTFDGLQSIVSSHHFESNEFVLVGKYKIEDLIFYKVLYAYYEPAFEFEGFNFYEIHKGPNPVDAKILQAGAGWGHVVVMQPSLKQLSLAGENFSGSSDYAIPIDLQNIQGPSGPIQWGEISNLNVNLDQKKIAFLNKIANDKTQLIWIPYSCTNELCSISTNSVEVTDLNFTPSFFGFVESSNLNRNGWVVNSPANELVVIQPVADRTVQWTGVGQVQIQRAQ